MNLDLLTQMVADQVNRFCTVGRREEILVARIAAAFWDIFAEIILIFGWDVVIGAPSCSNIIIPAPSWHQVFDFDSLRTSRDLVTLDIKQHGNHEQDTS